MLKIWLYPICYILFFSFVICTTPGPNPEEEPKPPTFVNAKRMLSLVVRTVGSNLLLKCKSDGYPKPDIVWLQDGKPLFSDSAKLSGSYGLSFDFLKLEDGGDYTCIVSNPYGSINFTFKVEVTERFPVLPIIFEGRPANQTAPIGGQAVFDCRYFSDLHAFARWVKYSAKSDSSSNTSDDNSGKTLMTSNDVKNNTQNLLMLTLDNVSYEDAGRYSCWVTNTIGTSKEDVWLTVVERPLEKAITVFTTPIIGIIATVSLLVVALFILIFYMRSRMNGKKKHLHITPPTQVFVRKRIIIQRQDTQASSAPLVKIEYPVGEFGDASTQLSEYDLPVDDEWEFNRERLVLGKPLGHGAFGQVIEAKAYGLNGNSNPSTVAIKMLKDCHSDQEIVDLISEMEVMKIIGSHKNIINLLGCCTQNGPLFVMVEYAANGNLRDFLRSKRPSYGYETPRELESKVITEKQLLNFAYQVSKGMDYLASRYCIHRDLAARNVLVMEDLVVKVADFGFARDVHETYYYRKKKNGLLPIKWMALEALFDRVFTAKSDVWSFGILLWEIMTLGALPYPSIPHEKLYYLLKGGYRLEKPKECSFSLYKLMQDCWRARPEDRPTFSSVVRELEKLLTNARDVEYLVLDAAYDESSSNDENCSLDSE